MASLTTSKSGARSILLVCGDGVRRPIRLGRLPTKAAQSVLARVEELAAHRRMGTAPGAELASWVASLSPVLHGRLARLGLVDAREEQAVVTLGELCDAFKARAAVKAGTAVNYAQTLDSLTSFFGVTTPIGSITPAEAEEWRGAIATARSGEGRRKKARMSADNTLAPATVSKRCKVAKQVFGAAVRWGWLAESPFASLRAGSQANEARAHYVDGPTIDAVLDACPSPEWRALIGLCRYAGLRCPSEVGMLTWDNVDFHAGRLRVRSPKTEHHGHDHAVRFVPLSPRLRLILTEAFEAAPAGSTLVVPMASRQSANLRTQFERTITRANCQPWPRLFQALRASCETDWVQRHPAHAVAKWLGHSPRIAQAHYLVTTDAHFRAVIEEPTEACTRGALSGALRAQKAAQQGSALDCTGVHEEQQTAAPLGNYAFSSSECEVVYNCTVGPV